MDFQVRRQHTAQFSDGLGSYWRVRRWTWKSIVREVLRRTWKSIVREGSATDLEVHRPGGSAMDLEVHRTGGFCDGLGSPSYGRVLRRTWKSILREGSATDLEVHPTCRTDFELGWLFLPLGLNVIQSFFPVALWLVWPGERCMIPLGESKQESEGEALRHQPPKSFPDPIDSSMPWQTRRPTRDRIFRC